MLPAVYFQIKEHLVRGASRISSSNLLFDIFAANYLLLFTLFQKTAEYILYPEKRQTCLLPKSNSYHNIR